MNDGAVFGQDSDFLQIPLPAHVPDDAAQNVRSIRKHGETGASLDYVGNLCDVTHRVAQQFFALVPDDKRDEYQHRQRQRKCQIQDDL